MKIIALKTHFHNNLSEEYPSEEIQSFFNILSEKYLKLSRIETALRSEKEISKADSEKFQQALLRLKNHEPIQYITGETEFYDLTFKVNNHTLIPRPETEELVEWIISDQKSRTHNPQPITVLDIGTGSGCIAISLAKNLPNSKISALDVSEEALKIAKENAVINTVGVDFFKTDILNIEKLLQQYDIIVSNPPYVRKMEKRLMQQNVLKYEPEVALFVNDEDPLVFYRGISQLAKKHLKPNGKLFFEINEYLGEEMKSLLKKEGFKNVEIKKDIFGRDRMSLCNL